MIAAQLSVLLHVHININHLVCVCLRVFVDKHYPAWSQCYGGFVGRYLVRFSNNVLLHCCLVRGRPYSFPSLSNLQKPGDLLFPQDIVLHFNISLLTGRIHASAQCPMSTVGNFYVHVELSWVDFTVLDHHVNSLVNEVFLGIIHVSGDRILII